jgi:Domain of unknown function (DUF4129)
VATVLCCSAPAPLPAAAGGLRVSGAPTQLQRAAPASADEARAAARALLSERRFREEELPRPLAGLFRTMGSALAPLWRPLVRAYLAVAARIPGGRATVWVVLAGLVVGLGAAVAGRWTRRITRGGASPAGGGDAPERLDPSTLLRLAENAESSGDLEAAVRLRFRAGLMTLGEDGVISWRPSITSDEVARAVRSGTFDRIAAQFDEVAYAGREAGPHDVVVAREGWPRVRQEAAERAT